MTSERCCVDVTHERVLLCTFFGICCCKQTKDGTKNKVIYVHIFIATGERKAIEFAIDESVPPGDIYFVGVPSPNIKLRVSALDIHRKKNFLGSTGGEIEAHKDIKKYLNY